MAAGRKYERRGDPFTLKVQRGEGPPCVQSWERRGTGRRWFTRVPVHLCQRLDAAQLGEVVRDYAQQLAQAGTPPELPRLAAVLAFDWHPVEQRVSVRAHDAAAPLGTVRVSLTTSHTGPRGQGVRFWLTCPRCSRRCGVLFASRWGQYGGAVLDLLTGCRACLGLTDESRQRHKCLDWASARLGQRAYKGGRRPWYEGRSMASHERAHGVFMRSFGRAFKGLGVPMPGQE